MEFKYDVIVIGAGHAGCEAAAAAALPAISRRPLHCRAHKSPAPKSSAAAARKFVSSSSSR